jgi:hypothetical protein
MGGPIGAIYRAKKSSNGALSSARRRVHVWGRHPHPQLGFRCLTLTMCHPSQPPRLLTHPPLRVNPSPRLPSHLNCLGRFPLSQPQLPHLVLQASSMLRFPSLPAPFPAPSLRPPRLQPDPPFPPLPWLLHCVVTLGCLQLSPLLHHHHL